MVVFAEYLYCFMFLLMFIPSVVKCGFKWHFDTHTHFFDEAFNEDRDEAVLRAVLSGVEKMVLPCCSEKSLSGIEELCKKFPENCFPTLGLHPEDIDIKNVDNQLKEIFD